MSSINFLRTYAHQFFCKKLGESIRIKRKETIEDIVIETDEKISRGIEFNVYGLAEEPLYEIEIKIPQKEPKENYDEDYINISIKGITRSEIKKLCEEFNKIYKKIK